MSRPLNHQRDKKYSLFAVATPGLEPLLAGELKRLSMGQIEPTPGGVSFRGDISALVRANLQLRTATRVLLRVARFPVRHLAQLNALSQKIAWENYFDERSNIRVTASCRESKIYHSKAAAQRVAQAIDQRLTLEKSPDVGGESPDKEGKWNTVQIRLQRDVCQISVDSSGAHLHWRGYKKKSVAAPLRENLAAAFLMMCDWDGTCPLVDPMCGSGTLAIEAGLIAAGIAPGLNREFAFEKWPVVVVAEKWRAERERAQRIQRNSSVVIRASDQDKIAVAATRANAMTAGLGGNLEIQQLSVSAVELDQTAGLIICNPPYGKRIGNPSQLKKLYASLGKLVRQNPTWRLGLITDSAQLVRATGLNFRRFSPTIPHGGIKVRLYQT